MSTERRAWIILGSILMLELVPFSFILGRSPRGIADRLYGFDQWHWPAWGGGLAISVAYVAYAARSFPLIRQNLLTVNAIKLAAVLMAIVTGTVEEIYFRKFLMDWAAHRGIADFVQVGISALLFGAAHGVWGLFAKEWQMALGAALATGILGALLAVVYLAAGRHVAPCVWTHMLINLAIEPWLIVSAASLGSRSRLATAAP